MNSSIFSTILEEIVVALPGALGAIFLDWEGETIDGYSHMGNTNLRIVGAQWGIIFYQTHELLKKHGHDTPSLITLCFEDQQVILRRVTENYLVLMALERDANLGRALALLQDAERRLKEEL